jgi:hypothetical protein
MAARPARIATAYAAHSAAGAHATVSAAKHTAGRELNRSSHSVYSGASAGMSCGSWRRPHPVMGDAYPDPPPGDAAGRGPDAQAAAAAGEAPPSHRPHMSGSDMFGTGSGRGHTHRAPQPCGN